MSDVEVKKVEEKWVNTEEAAEITGYSFGSIRSLVKRISKQPEDEREIKLWKRAYRWELWLPDLMSYVDKPGRGPQPKRKISASE
ncbi:MAG: hypothetical protein ABI690_14490 [Chloroflexota bacterium]